MCYQLCRVRSHYHQYRFVCFDCRRYWKSPGQKKSVNPHAELDKPAVCPECQRLAVTVTCTFRPPSKRDVAGWTAAKQMIESPKIPAPTTLSQTKTIVKRITVITKGHQNVRIDSWNRDKVVELEPHKRAPADNFKERQRQAPDYVSAYDMRKKRTEIDLADDNVLV
jgi:hypothetical protein